ncbi:uncharacterized protein B0H64DRAFT_384813 [Chaetomium fimeti]|uniref:SET domain-containing protein n=1 Tax=Chaetomium fimeti TaxID=1854472 RepID=A0AAE0HLB2_9PEZI|nr:hypothetical protein B0H64DRAFT_384813 [Chaetomium fimeti]
MEAFEELIRWAEDRGVELHGVTPHTLPGRGVGIVATKPLKAGDLILQIPTSTLRTLDTVRPEIKESLPKDTKVHALLAAELALDKPNSEYSPWNAVMPSRDSIISSLPLAWDPRLHAYLPKPALALLRKQQAKFTRDWAAIQQTPFASPTAADTTTPPITRQDYLYAWLLVNTRTFYHEASPAARRAPREDRMVLQPVADLFNHSGTGCAVTSTAARFTITADRAYGIGDEVSICYGQHHNDFLLTEYGFVLPEHGHGADGAADQNRWDEACLDDALLPALGAAHRALLEERGFLGNYVVDAGTVCYRTQVALRVLCVSPGQWERLVSEGEDGGEALQEEVDRLLLGLLRRYRGTVAGKIEEVEGQY